MQTTDTQSAPQQPPRTSGDVRHFIVLPAYNEALAIENLLNRIREIMTGANLAYEVIVVDDGSGDETAGIVQRMAQSMPIHLVQHAVNQGLGRTIRDGLATAAERATAQDIIITLDADDTHDPKFIPAMLEKMHTGLDVVTASRYQPGAQTIGVPFHRRMLTFGAKLLFRLVFPIPGVKDYTCGYRAYRTPVIQNAFAQMGDTFIDQGGFQCMVDILLKLHPMGVRFGEVPFTLRYDIKGGVSKMNVTHTVFNTLRLMIRRRLNK